MQHRLQIESLPSHISPFNLDRIFRECEEALEMVGYENELTITINGYEHFIYNVHMNKASLKRYIEISVTKSCMNNLFSNNEQGGRE